MTHSLQKKDNFKRIKMPLISIDKNGQSQTTFMTIVELVSDILKNDNIDNYISYKSISFFNYFNSIKSCRFSLRLIYIFKPFK